MCHSYRLHVRERIEIVYSWRGTSADGCADPRHGTWDVVPYRKLITDPFETYLELDWQLTCAAGAPMPHHLRKVY